MQCKLCGAQLEPDMELCPECGMKPEKEEQTVPETAVMEAEPSCSSREEQKGQAVPKKTGRGLKIALAVATVAVLLCVMVLVVFKDDMLPGHWTFSMEGTVPKNGNSEDVTCQGSYTGSVWELKLKKDTVVARVGDMSLTNGQLQALFNSILYSYSGGTSTSWDADIGMDRQVCALDETLTWQQFLLKTTLQEWVTYAVLNQAAEAADFELTEAQQKSLDGLYDSMYDSYVATGDFASVDEMLQASIGPGCDFQNYAENLCFNTVAMSYYNQMIEEQEVTEAVIEEFFKEYEDKLAEYDIKKDGSYAVNVRHILIGIEELTGKTTGFTDEDWENCKAEAEKILGWWLENDVVDEESFGQMANQFSDDPGSNTNGGLYTDVSQGDMVESFDEWCFDENRKPGDYGLVKSSYGYHIMYFSSSEEVWHSYCRQGASSWLANQALNEMIDAAELKASYKKIALWDAAYSD